MSVHPAMQAVFGPTSYIQTSSNDLYLRHPRVRLWCLELTGTDSLRGVRLPKLDYLRLGQRIHFLNTSTTVGKFFYIYNYGKTATAIPVSLDVRSYVCIALLSKSPEVWVQTAFFEGLIFP